MEYDFWTSQNLPKPSKKEYFYFSQHQEHCDYLMWKLECIPRRVKIAILDSGKEVSYTSSRPVNWGRDDSKFPDNAIYLGEGFRREDFEKLDSETLLEEINKLLD